MKRPWQVWLVFAACVASAVGAMAWLTREAVDADRQRRAAQAEADLEQRVSLAVWRIDTELAPIIAAEVIRPAAAFRPGAIAADLPPYVLLQFQILPGGAWQSPQVNAKSSDSPLTSRLAELSKSVTYQKLLPELPDTPLPSAADIARNQFNTNTDRYANAPTSNAASQMRAVSGAANLPTNEADSPLDTTLQQQVDNPFSFVEGNRAANTYANNQPQVDRQVANQAPPDQQAQVQQPASSKAVDFQQRSKRIQTAAQQGLLNYNQQSESIDTNLDSQATLSGIKAPAAPNGPPEQVGVSRPLWMGDRLVLARRVTVGGTTIVQGSWLDWTLLKSRLLSEAGDLFPQADLVPVNGDGAGDPARMLAGLPVRLVVNETPAMATVGPTLKTALWIGWSAVLVTILATAALLAGVMALSERRAAFVSSVTHELRTPLTTFRMYAEMLAKGMVPDAARRQEYFETLQKEAERLTLLVENVLSYARLERGRRPQAHERVTVVDLLSRVRKRLEQRAAQAGMECVVELNKKTAAQEFTTDFAVVEQILFNLVDNAAKYAQSATDRRIHVEANRNGQYVKFIVRDHGPGIGGGAAAHSQPFEKSAQESAETAPGVGLGLALCRRLARELGGRLEVAAANGDGASVTLSLPIA